MRRRSTHRFRKRRRRTRRQRRGGFRYAEPSAPITGGGGDPRYTFSQPLADVFRTGTHGVSNMFNSFMGRSHDVSPNVSDQPYLS